MDYSKIYNQLIDRAKDRLLEVYTEKHHIIPKCMNGSDDQLNIVSLTAEEHYIAHLLLVKIYPANNSLWYAANMMANRNNKTYAWIKKRHASNVSKQFLGYKHTNAAKQKMSNAIQIRWNDNREGFIEEQRRRASNPKKKKRWIF